MAFSSVPYFILYTQSLAATPLAVTAVDSIIGANVYLQPTSSAGYKALWNVDFDNGIFGLAVSGNQLVLDAPAPQSSQELLVLSQVSSSSTQRWDMHSKPGFILSTTNSGLVMDDAGRGGAGTTTWIHTFNGSPAQQWTFMPLTSPAARAMI